nr:MAG TPA: hypothetical protein [Caudoviricetes sp.]
MDIAILVNIKLIVGIGTQLVIKVILNIGWRYPSYQQNKNNEL